MSNEGTGREVADPVPSVRRSMTQRVATAAFGAFLTLAALFSTHALPFLVLAIVAAVIGFAELVKIAGLEDRPLAGVLILLLCYVTPVLVAWRTPPGDWRFWAVVWAAYLAGCFGVWQGIHRGYAAPMSAAWLGAPLATLFVTHQQTALGQGPFSANASLMLLVPLWIGDTVALFVGKAFGRRKLAPAISPSKTWEGAIGNFVACVASSVAIGALLHVPWAPCVLVGASAGFLGQLGDLAQSALKRVAGIKDSGAALPGHGGILDRLDSFLLSAVPSATALWLMVPDLYRIKIWP